MCETFMSLFIFHICIYVLYNMYSFRMLSCTSFNIWFSDSKPEMMDVFVPHQSSPAKHLKIKGKWYAEAPLGGSRTASCLSVGLVVLQPFVIKEPLMNTNQTLVPRVPHQIRMTLISQTVTHFVAVVLQDWIKLKINYSLFCWGPPQRPQTTV